MNLDKLLAEFKETADRTLLRGMDDTIDLEERIYMNIEKKGKKRFRFIYPVSAALVAVALVIGFTPYILQKESTTSTHTPKGTSAEPGTHQKPDPKAHPASDDQVIMGTVDEIIDVLRVGMTQDQIKAKISFPYTVVDNYGGSGDDGTEEYWGYSILAKEGYQQKEWTMIDTEALLKRDVGLAMLVGWKDKKLYWYTISYVQGKKVYLFKLNSNGTVTEDVVDVPQDGIQTPRTTSIFDLKSEEEDRYYNYMYEKKDELLRGLSPTDIVKLYVRAVQDGQLEMQYALRIVDEGVNKPTLEQYLEGVKKDPVRERSIWRGNKKMIEMGSKIWVEHTDDETIVWTEYKNKSHETTGFIMRQDDQGIWKVRWRP
ncbi:hypothetical protein ABE237_12775 [Brevibacillus formosus]|uniref:hypothetical protein n=1 Tax=Brevibacillus TaxID=55080 RepID=UPI000D0F9EDD|nr:MULTISPECIES: hypothetical protein [Brevibacillus]MBG9942168.1 hypothetical protein [Brevibacillus formosus]MED1944810.1 hypothetical protein [Brevibacillus formosus]MED1996503.1 hypothetical protein [Brevibacillus formosus]MED2081472.1 hypothetical protein [Brevibacillus formosus]PSK19871.1 hypothetical protein C7R94_07100 [Brevibacillus sp. NRRL NRS-603]